MGRLVAVVWLKCNMFSIPFSVDGQWVDWLQWSGCSVTCSRSLFQLTVTGPVGCSGLVVVIIADQEPEHDNGNA